MILPIALLTGIISMGYGVSGLFFLRFWRQTRDRLFFVFAIAFWLLSIQQLAFALSSESAEDLTYLFVIRLVAFILILGAIVDKNLASKRNSSS
ncbi:MAG: DUF5985 family protein [Bacteroidota bacterium]|nr:DUF5985 family protein [Bacteroidota bacterium]MDP4234342.1 DUF5985 family protein [Bacteroidota bacterium]MDP4243276.1 DUF5985 family protein [Bacteroidota bacterium]MDP4289101.1 DUF5985 family protein [Bacteroidota bacterium]